MGKAVEPDVSQNLVSGWTNGSAFYFPAMATVQDLKTSVYGADKAPKALRAGCYGRMMDDSDNLALAVRTFCKRDPKIVLWEEETEKAKTSEEPTVLTPAVEALISGAQAAA